MTRNQSAAVSLFFLRIGTAACRHRRNGGPPRVSSPIRSALASSECVWERDKSRFLRSCQNWQLRERRGHSNIRARQQRKKNDFGRVFFRVFVTFFDKFALSLGDL
jgi:hypothetical protein